VLVGQATKKIVNADTWKIYFITDFDIFILLAIKNTIKNAII
jgi:hypothetical protein